MIDKKFKNQLYKQDYSPQPKIEGVKIVDLKYFIDDSGGFLELARLTKSGGLKDSFPNFKIKQINWSQVLPGVIKAGHLHKKQADIWFVPPSDRLLVGLLDARVGSKSYGVKMRLVLGAGRSCLLYIPPYIIHGCANLYSAPATLVYLVNQNFSVDKRTCDEWRVSYKVFGENFWQIRKL